jgi:hypothetical protein
LAGKIMTETSDPERVDACVILREARIGDSMSDPALCL